MKPKILLTPRDDTSTYNGDRQLQNMANYFSFVTKHGGIPMMIGTNIGDFDEIIPLFDGLLITGGDDVDPSLYGEEVGHCWPGAKDLEETDIALYKGFKEAHKSIFGICRGIQMMNVIEGGTLIQDISSYDAKYLEHNQIQANQKDSKEYHSCSCKEGSLLYKLLGKSCMVNSFHHQAIKDLAPFFQATCFSEDGLIEGIEHDNIFAVQWHPERLQECELQNRLMAHFISLCQESYTSK